MSVNKQRPQVLVLPEDDADRQLAIGFHLVVPRELERQLQILPPADGWMKVLDCFQSDHIGNMNRYRHRTMVLLMDFDESSERLDHAKHVIPTTLTDRVFVLGSWIDPESLRRATGLSLEQIGGKLAKECRDDTDETWRHELLQHNAAELERLRNFVRPILFGSS